MQPPGKPPGKRSQLPLGQGPDSFLDVAGALPALDEVLLPGDRRPPAPPPVDDDPVDMEELAELESRMAKFASGVSVANKRHEIRKLTAPAEGTAKSRLTLGEDEPQAPALNLARTQQVLAEDDTADRLSAFAEKVAVRAKDPRFMALAKEGAKQAIIDNLNPVIAISANLAEAGMRANALRDWQNLSDGERVLQVAGLAGNVAEILSAVTPPPAGPAFKALGIGMVLIKIAAEANAPKKEKVVPQAPPRRGTQMLRAPGAPTATPRSPTGALTPPPQPQLPPRPVSKTGPLTLPTPPVQPPRPVAKTGPLPALPEEAPKDERAFVEKLKAFGKQLKDFF